MEIHEYVRILLRRGWIIVLLAVITAASAYVFSKLQRPVYRSTLYLNAIPARPDWGLQQMIKNQLRNYSGQITSDKILQRVDSELELDMPPDMLRSKISVDPVESDLLIQISVDDYDPLLAKMIADKTADVFVIDITEQMQVIDQRDRVLISVRDYARPGSLFKPKTKFNVLAGGVLGALLGMIIIFVLEWLEADIVRSEEDVERYLDVPVLGAIPVVAESAPRSGRLTKHA